MRHTNAKTRVTRFQRITRVNSWFEEAQLSVTENSSVFPLPVTFTV